LGRAEAYASKNGVFAAIIDGAGMGLGFNAFTDNPGGVFGN